MARRSTRQGLSTMVWPSSSSMLRQRLHSAQRGYCCIFVLALIFSFTRSVIDVVRVGLWLHKLGKGYYKVGKLHRLQQAWHPDASMGFPGTQPHPAETAPTAVSETAALVPRGQTAVRASEQQRICLDVAKTGDTFFITAGGKRLHRAHCHH